MYSEKLKQEILKLCRQFEINHTHNYNGGATTLLTTAYYSKKSKNIIIHIEKITNITYKNTGLNRTYHDYWCLIPNSHKIITDKQNNVSENYNDIIIKFNHELISLIESYEAD